MSDSYKRDIAAFELIYKKSFKQLCNRLYSFTGDKEASKDIVQEVFYKVWKHRESFFKVESKDAYLYQSAFFAALNYIKRSKKQAIINEVISRQHDNYPLNPQESLLYQEMEKRFSATIQKLPPKCKEVFILSRFDGLDYSQIASKLKISNNTVEKHIVKALKLLRTALSYVLLILPISN